MNVFLTGATGYLGSHVAARLRAAGHAVFGLSRNAAAAEKLRQCGVSPVPGDLREPDTLAEAARRADAVVHAAFSHDTGSFEEALRLDRGATAAFVEALAGTGKPLVATSGSGLLGDTGPEPVGEDFPVNPAFLLAPRVAAEQDVLRAAGRGVRTVVLRFPLYVYGHGGSVFVPWLIEQAKKAGAVPYVGTGEHRSSAVHVDDAADLYLLALERAPAGSLFHGASEHGVRARALAEAIGRARGVPARSVTPEEARSAWGPRLAAFLSMNNQTASERARAELGWQPRAATTLLADVETGSYRP
jgi:nucleoside-diphosphate-sugar epimerase